MTRIAVVGAGLVVPGASDPAGFWRLRLTDADPFIPPPPDRWDPARFAAKDTVTEDKTEQSAAGFITGSDHDGEPTTAWLRHSVADALKTVKRRDSARFGLVLGYTPDFNQHLEEAGVALGARDRCRRLGVPADRLAERYARALRDPSRFLPHRVGQAVAELLPPGTSVRMVDAACASSLYAVDVGAKALLAGDHDIVVCGGASALTPRTSVLFGKLGGLSRGGRIRALDERADGTLFADGAAAVALKTLDRALADGDRVLAVLLPMGCSSDGRGAAIHAPNPAGQSLAIRRAHAHAGGRPPVAWISAHATGTPKGDLTEYSVLREHYDGSGPVRVTANKSRFGHTGWAAGVVSLIEVIAALEHETLPPQPGFAEPPAEFGPSDLDVPRVGVPWPRGESPRFAAVSGFGFGGINAHLIVTEHHPAAPTPVAAPIPERVAIVGWSARFPGFETPEQVVDWLSGKGSAPAKGFGERPLDVPFGRIRLPPPVVRTIDRCQLLLTECAHDLRALLAGIWERYTDTTGVFLGSMGPTGASMRYADRCHTDDVAEVLRASGATDEQVERHVTEVRAAIPASNPNSFAGMMPNVIPARVCHHFGLRGPSLTVDTGRASALSALDVAARYIRCGDLDLALVAGANGNTLPGYAALLDRAPGELSEGAVMFALAAETVATAAGLPILGYLEDRRPEGAFVQEPGDDAFLGGAGAIGLLRNLCGPAGQVHLAHPDDPAGLGVTVTGVRGPSLPR